MLNVRMHHERNVSCQYPETEDFMAFGTEHGMLIFLFWCVNNYMHLKLINKWSKLFWHNSCYLQFCLENKHEPEDGCQIELLPNV